MGAPALLRALDESGLRGQGGAWYPTGAKWKAVAASGGRPVVVVNGAESEPASAKDALLLGRLPHLVLDGAAVAASALHASRVVVYAPPERLTVVAAAVDRRRQWGVDRIDPELVAKPDGFIAGQESAVVNAVNGRAAIPGFTTVTPVWRRGVNSRPTLVQNAATLAQVALIARFGPTWFRQLGPPESPGSALLTVTASVTRVVEVALGTRLGEVLRLVGDSGAGSPGVLLGGFGGTWLDAGTAEHLALADASVRSVGASLGAGVVAVLPARSCPLAETARVVRYLEGNSAGQCGPCVHGLAELAAEAEQLAFGPGPVLGSAERIRKLCGLIEGRGACRHPDGATTLARSALRAFPQEVLGHERYGPCRAAHAPSFLPTSLAGPPVAVGAR